MNCPFCGKAIRPGERECPYCATPLPDPSVAAGVVPSEWLEQVRQVRESLRHRPSPLVTSLGLIGVLLAGLATAYFCALFIPGEPIVLKFLLLFFALVGGLMVVGGVWGLWKVTLSQLERVPAIVVAKREQHLPDENLATSYYLTLKTEDGQTKEYLVRQKLFRQLNAGDVGIAYFRGYLMDFRRVQISRI